jgi:hypothetical protein
MEYSFEIPFSLLICLLTVPSPEPPDKPWNLCAIFTDAGTNSLNRYGSGTSGENPEPPDADARGQRA